MTPPPSLLTSSPFTSDRFSVATESSLTNSDSFVSTTQTGSSLTLSLGHSVDSATTVTAPIGEDGMPAWVLYAIIGGSIGGALVCCVIAALVVVYIKRRRADSASKREVGLVPIGDWPSARASQPVGNYAVIPRSLKDSAGSTTMYGNPPELDSCRDEPAAVGANPSIHYAAVDLFPLPRESINYGSAAHPVGYGAPEFVSARAEEE
jgi:hypothetical protein